MLTQRISPRQQRELADRGFTRRGFYKIASLLAAGASLPFYNERALAQLSMVHSMPPDAVKINANENPMGPCAEAAEAIHAIVQKGGRYLYEETFEMASTLAEQEGVRFSWNPEASYVQAFAGSSDPLHRAVLAFCSKDRPFVVADPGYEAGARAAKFIGARVVTVPLVKGSAAHDVRAMAAADPNAGLIYVCNPNNPTGTVTPRAEIEWLAANKPAGAVILLDEAYIHLSRSAVMSSFLAAADRDVIILRTFSKLYGMAGLRAGAAIGRPDLLQKMAMYTAGALPVTAMVGANASLKAKRVVAERREIIAGIREETFDFLHKNNIEFIPSEANCFMMNARRPGKEFYEAMTRRKVYIGRVWPVWPTWVRVTVGTRDEMSKFREACLQCYSA
ncbi:MAG TPA: pyridoxal phosphate-dependent aminotransferase [Bryobacteraceae bacterium]|nr:pyridoxal phosphate-dependent aminotransferase [Bryobacteraceae bacterium]